jgi:hypothetical protein
MRRASDGRSVDWGGSSRDRVRNVSRETSRGRRRPPGKLPAAGTACRAAWPTGPRAGRRMRAWLAATKPNRQLRQRSPMEASPQPSASKRLGAPERRTPRASDPPRRLNQTHGTRAWFQAGRASVSCLPDVSRTVGVAGRSRSTPTVQHPRRPRVGELYRCHTRVRVEIRSAASVPTLAKPLPPVQRCRACAGDVMPPNPDQS